MFGCLLTSRQGFLAVLVVLGAAVLVRPVQAAANSISISVSIAEGSNPVVADLTELWNFELTAHWNMSELCKFVEALAPQISAVLPNFASIHELRLCPDDAEALPSHHQLDLQLSVTTSGAGTANALIIVGPIPKASVQSILVMPYQIHMHSSTVQAALVTAARMLSWRRFDVTFPMATVSGLKLQVFKVLGVSFAQNQVEVELQIQVGVRWGVINPGWGYAMAIARLRLTPRPVGPHLPLALDADIHTADVKLVAGGGPLSHFANWILRLVSNFAAYFIRSQFPVDFAQFVPAPLRLELQGECRIASVSASDGVLSILLAR